MDRTKAHQSLVDDILYAVGSLPTVRVWKTVCGVFRDFSSNRTIKVGLPGAADITGILSNGKRLEIEVKTGSAKQNDKQKLYQAMIEKFGGVYILARDVESTLTRIKEIL